MHAKLVFPQHFECMQFIVLIKYDHNDSSLPQNHLSGGGTCQVDDRTYQLEMSLFIGEDIETMTNESFSPQGTYRKTF